MGQPLVCLSACTMAKVGAKPFQYERCWNNDPPLPKDVRARVEKWAETGKSEPGPAPEK